MDGMQRLTEHMRNRPNQIKAEGKKVVAHFVGDYMPVEMIHAAGAISVGLVYGGDSVAVDAAASVIYRQMCPFARAQYGYSVLKEIPYLEMMDLLAAPITCQHLRRAADLYEYHTDTPIFRLGIPQPVDGQRALDYFKGELGRLQERVEELTGNKVTDEKLRESIEIFRKIRDQLKKISELRKSQRPPITTTDFIRLNHWAHLADPKVMAEGLKSIYDELSAKEGPEVKGPRILITGPNIAMGDYRLLEMIDESGAKVVVEDIAEGVLFYWENVASNGDPMDALTDRYIVKRSNCAFVHPNMQRHFDFILKLANDFSVDGIVWYQLRQCETWSIESYFMAETLKKMTNRIPMIKLESDYDIADTGQIKTRIESFVETFRRN